MSYSTPARHIVVAHIFSRWSISIISVTVCIIRSHLLDDLVVFIANCSQECRLILNLQKFPIAEPDISTELPEFTTVVTNDHSRPETS